MFRVFNYLKMFRGRQQIVICVIAGVMVTGFVLLRHLPLRKKIKAVKQAKATQTLAITKASAESEQLPVIKEQLLKLRTLVGNYEANIPAQRALGEFLRRIASLMDKHNLKEQLVQPDKETETDNLNCIPVNMHCKGRLEQIFEFYKSLQNLDRLVRIERVKLENDNDFSGEVYSQAKVFIYYGSEPG